MSGPRSAALPDDAQLAAWDSDAASDPEATPPSVLADGYMRGYLTGMIRGDGMMLRREVPEIPNGGGTYVANHFRLALADVEALARYAHVPGAVRGPDETVQLRARPRDATCDVRRSERVVAAAYEAIIELIPWPVDPGANVAAGFLAGIFDAEGSCSRGILRISNSDETMLGNDSAGTRLTSDLDGRTRTGDDPNGVANMRVRRRPSRCGRRSSHRPAGHHAKTLAHRRSREDECRSPGDLRSRISTKRSK